MTAAGARLRLALGRRPWLQSLLITALVSLAVVPLHGGAGIRIVEARSFDILSTLFPARPSEPGAVIVAIDEPSFAELNERWPWARTRHAALVEALRSAGARVIGIDIVFAEPSIPEADVALAAALDRRVVLAADREVIAMDQGTQVSRVGPLPLLLENGASFGITSVELDSDSVVRRVPSGADSFAAAVLALGGGQAGTVPPGALAQFFGGARSYPTVSYYQALDPPRYLPPDFFRGRTVLVGLSLKATPATDSGAADAFATPFTQQTATLTAGVEVHATLLDNLRERLWIAPAPPLAIGFAVVACALLGAGTGRASVSWRTGLVATLCIVGIAAASFTMLRVGRVWLPPVTPILAGLAGFGSRFALDYARERRARAAVSEAFSRYVTPALVEELARNPEALRLGGETRELTILFCDVRGFTGLSERLKADPVRLMGIINRLLDALSEQILDARGTIDKYMGDCVMAFWNAPLPEPDHAAAAVGAAIRMVEAVDALNIALRKEDPSLPPLAVGVGINTGICVVGNIGSRWRYDYSVLGDAVNLASRLEGLTKEYRVPILLGEVTATALANRFCVEEIDRIAVRGRSEATPIFSVRRATSSSETGPTAAQAETIRMSGSR